MFHLSTLRICHFTTLINYPAIYKFVYRFIGVTLGSMFACSMLHAESNVAGDEIIIYADDSFRPAPRYLGVKDKPGDALVSKKTSTSNLGSMFESHLSEDSSDQSDDENIRNNDLWQRIRDGYAMPDSSSELIAVHEKWYSSRPDYVKRMVERSQKYLFHIVEEVEKRGMPTEIALLPMVESAYNPKANSTSRASGIWQFIPSTGKNFGLKQNWWVDNRRNIMFATDAALTYLQKLHTMFGAWDLALAAYNAGEGTVARAIARNQKLGLPTDYESLNLPAETRNYVPKLQAIKNLMTNPGNYGLKIQTISNTAYFTKVSAPAQIDAHLAAKLAEISDDEFHALNPSYNRPVIINNSDKHGILLPILAAKTFRDNLATYDKPLVSWQTYYAKRGERMDKIANKFGIQVEQLRDVNGLSNQNKIKNTATILVPNGKHADFTITNAIAETSSNITAQTDSNVEANPDIVTEQNSANIDLTNIQNNTVSNSESTSNTNEPDKTHNITHKVKKGESIGSIAKKYHVSIKQITASNSLKNNRVKAGQILTIEVIETKIEESQHSKTSRKQPSARKASSTTKSGHKKIKSKSEKIAAKHKRH
ncbi:membrane-bound lytic murein transglycosylase D precursor [mine drainage metagenome]|uniref:Membrane-bound lytic murein transglycosylase D n=1 Tax=mine drainage metagenome TaxID=410659 RepID=A0A1J5R0T7_9ZZZZ